eukprot:10197565-Alexandrium_andersonii.AAC.1
MRQRGARQSPESRTAHCQHLHDELAARCSEHYDQRKGRCLVSPGPRTHDCAGTVAAALRATEAASHRLSAKP